jgi:3-hexulose-6-phosphate synthase
MLYPAVDGLVERCPPKAEASGAKSLTQRSTGKGDKAPMFCHVIDGPRVRGIEGEWTEMTPPDLNGKTASARVLELMRRSYTFQISVDTNDLPRGLVVAAAALAAGVTLVEMGTPLLKCEGVFNVITAFRRQFPEALLLADMKTMDGGAGEAHAVFGGGANIIDFLALAGTDTAKNICAVRDDYRQAEPATPRLAFADILVPHQGPATHAVEVARGMIEAGVDGVGVHLQFDARRANSNLLQSSYLVDVAGAIFDEVGGAVSVQVVGGLSADQALELARHGLRAFVISGNLGLPDSKARYGLPPDAMERHIAEFIGQVRGETGPLAT